ncbi:MAG: hypothetical protein ABFR53_07550 [Actinomycetota bacterium]
MRKYLLIFVFAALALTACRAESNLTLDINEDGSATVGAEVGFDEEMLDLLSQTGDDPADLFTEDLPEEAAGFEPYTRTEGDMSFFGFSNTIEDLETYDFSDFGQEMFSDFADFSYTTDGNTATLNASIASADVGGGLGDLPIDPSDITGDIFSANLIVSMPGTVSEHNADEVREDGTLVWTIPLTGSVDVTAVSDIGSSSTSWILWVLIGVLVVGIIAAVTATIITRKESQKAVDAAIAAHAAATDDAPAGQEPDTPEDNEGGSGDPDDAGEEIDDED